MKVCFSCQHIFIYCILLPWSPNVFFLTEKPLSLFHSLPPKKQHTFGQAYTISGKLRLYRQAFTISGCCHIQPDLEHFQICPFTLQRLMMKSFLSVYTQSSTHTQQSSAWTVTHSCLPYYTQGGNKCWERMCSWSKAGFKLSYVLLSINFCFNKACLVYFV